GSNSSYRIQTDYDFLLVKLFRTDGGLAQVLREVHLLRLLKDRNITELASVIRHRAITDLTDVDLTEKEKKVLMNSNTTTKIEEHLGWKEVKVDKYTLVITDKKLKKLHLPSTIMGVVRGMAARCVGSKISVTPEIYVPETPETVLCGALCLVFDSESIGFAGALARVFKRVGVINFSKSFTDYGNPIRANLVSTDIVSITAPYDIAMNDRVVEIKVDSKLLR
ncbi:hypothetical protein GBAR_LOCUS368, partial [Geodia barretti]